MLGVNEVYNWQCLKSIRVMYLNISSSQSAELIICQIQSGINKRRPFNLLIWKVFYTARVDSDLR